MTDDASKKDSLKIQNKFENDDPGSLEAPVSILVQYDSGCACFGIMMYIQ